ncbi:XRE family transcriptional regulator [Anaerolineales bacterium HSG6]|nr:XRE family transcriptional regulator [Anaerolineales bacterium HSG6]MDM8530738.1 XRE family transcriptional regulator [Anaerolineales bacterium HSG25]
MNTDIVNIIFGLKVRQARLDSKLSLSQLAKRCELSPSYITEIEKGRKHPKADKIMKIAEVLGKSYDELVSLKLAPSLTSLEALLASHLLQQFPFEEFGLEVNNLVNLFTRTPNRASALARTIIEIGRQYDMKGEHFLRAALRAYQEIRENYFPDIEKKAANFAQNYNFEGELPLSLTTLETVIKDEFSYSLDRNHLADDPILSIYRSVYIPGKKPKLLLNSALRDSQIKFLLARELGYQYLNLKKRANTSAPDTVDSFQQVLNDFKASYFAGALLIPQSMILEDVKAFFRSETWHEAHLLGLLGKYDVTPEMLLYRISELMPQFFGIKPHFVRFNGARGNYELIKQLNMNKLLLPSSGTVLDEHHCRRWLAVGLLREMSEYKERVNGQPLVGVQISEFLRSKERVFSFGFVRPLALSPHLGSSVTMGFSITPEVTDTIRFINDSAIPVKLIHETCERCPLTAEECQERAVEPKIYETEQRAKKRTEALQNLVEQL